MGVEYVDVLLTEHDVARVDDHGVFDRNLNAVPAPSGKILLRNVFRRNTLLREVFREIEGYRVARLNGVRIVDTGLDVDGAVLEGSEVEVRFDGFA